MSTTNKAEDIVEQYLDEMLEAEANLDLDGFVKRFEPQDISGFGESRFKKDMYAIREDLGGYVSREYLGSLKGFANPDRDDARPDSVRHVWRGVFEKNETLIVVGVHESCDVLHVNEFTYRH